MFRRLASRGSVKAAAFAGGVALSAYMLNSAALQAAEEPSIFVINGFYMAMREKFTKPGTSIYYYLVEWDPAELSWEDFRGKVLGATDPAKAEGGSLRRAIYTDWKQLGLAAEPDVGDNGVAPTRTQTRTRTRNGRRQRRGLTRALTPPPTPTAGRDQACTPPPRPSRRWPSGSTGSASASRTTPSARLGVRGRGRCLRPG